MLILLAQIAQTSAQSPAPIVNNYISAPSSNPWPTVISALGGAFIGATAGIGGHLLVHHLTVKREQRQRLLNAYAKFAGSCYRFLSHCREVRAALDNVDYDPVPPQSPGDADYEHQEQEIVTQTRDNAIKERGKALDEMASTRAELILLLADDGDAAAEVWMVVKNTFDARNKQQQEIEYQQNLLDIWVKTTASNLSKRVGLRAWLGSRNVRDQKNPSASPTPSVPQQG